LNTISNYTKLCVNESTKNSLDILEEGIRAAFPDKPLKPFFKKNSILLGKKSINLENFDNVYLIAYGKAADSMAKSVYNASKIKKGIIIIPKGSKSIFKHKKFQIIYSSHPIPNSASVKAGKTVLDFVNSRKNNDFIIFLISGGGSSLLSAPLGISITEKQQITEKLIKSGAKIQEINCIRKHLSAIKGGRLVQTMKCSGIAFVMSDVIGNDLSSISSGCTHYDKTTYGDSLQIIKKYHLTKSISKNILDYLTSGYLGKIPETPKKSTIKNIVVATNHTCLIAMKKKAEKLGYKTKIIYDITGNVNFVSKKLASLFAPTSKRCIIFGGETTVNVTGNGKGGRNQELVLLLLKKMKKTYSKFVIASIGTDGIDGNTKYAGAITNYVDVKNSIIEKYLKNNDSNSFFKKYGGLIKTGFTHTNLLDIGVICSD